MNHTEIRVVTSAKGGVGKSTVTVGLGAALARTGKRVLLIDCDAANRSLDLMLGLADGAIWGLSDVLAGRCDATTAILAVPEMEESLYLLPVGGDCPLGEYRDAFVALVRSLSYPTEEAPDDTDLRFDHILIDTPGGYKEILSVAAAPADEALIVSSAQKTAVRSAEMTADYLRGIGVTQEKLIINAYMGGEQFFSHTKARTNRRTQVRATEELFGVVDSVALPLLGVVPFDEQIWTSGSDLQADGSYAVIAKRTRNDHFTQAFDNIAARCAHKNIPLFSDSQSRA